MKFQGRNIAAVVVMVMLVGVGMWRMQSFTNSEAGSAAGTALSAALTDSKERLPEPVIPANLTEWKQSTDGCKFRGCPDKSPFLYFFTPHRNRAQSYNRFVRTLTADVLSGDTGIDFHCVCILVSDFDEVVVGPPIDAALADWPLDYHVLSMKEQFSPAGGFERALKDGVTTDPERSIIFRVDADMVFYKGFTKRVMQHIHLGVSGYAPASWSQKHNASDWYDGYWRVSGSGMIGFYKKDFLTIFPDGKMPLNKKNDYGDEDTQLLEKLHHTLSSYRVLRDCAPELWHLWHRKNKWLASIDGITEGKGFGAANRKYDLSRPWKKKLPRADGPAHLKRVGLLEHGRCRGLATRLFPG